MPSRDDIRAGRGSSTKREKGLSPEPKVACFSTTCAGLSCCMSWFIIACVFAGLFGWQFSLDHTSTMSCPGYSYVEYSPAHAPTSINKLNFIPNGADEACVRTQENIASTMSMIEIKCDFPAILALSSTDVCHTTELRNQNRVASYKMCDHVECRMQFTSSINKMATLDTPSNPAFKTISSISADTAPLVSLLADTSKINKHVLTPSSVDETNCRSALGFTNTQSTQHLTEVDVKSNAHLYLPSVEETFSKKYYVSNSNFCLIQYANNAGDTFAQAKLVFSS